VPTVLHIDGLRFFFYSAEPGEPPHVHVAQGGRAAKFWLEPVELARSDGFRDHELAWLRALVIEHRVALWRAWHGFHGDGQTGGGAGGA
jgi:hypothetical protein